MEKNPNTTNHSESKENHWAIWLLQSLVSAISYILQTAEVHISCQDIPVIVDKVLSLKSFSEALWTWLLWKKKRIISHSASLLGSAVPPAAPALLWLGHSSFTSILWFPIIAFPQLQTIITDTFHHHSCHIQCYHPCCFCFKFIIRQILYFYVILLYVVTVLQPSLLEIYVSNRRLYFKEIQTDLIHSLAKRY